MPIDMHGCVGGSIACYSGAYFDFQNPRVNDVHIRDIAFSLGNICRYNGHCRFYSVAEHSVLCYREAVRRRNDIVFHLATLMHDAAEAYTGDIAKPLKNLLPDFMEMEAKIEGVIRRRYGITDTYHREVKQIDSDILTIEKMTLFPGHRSWTGVEGRPAMKGSIEYWSPERASMEFLGCFTECWVGA